MANQSIGDILAEHRAPKEESSSEVEHKEPIAAPQEPEPFTEDGDKTVSEVEFPDKGESTVPVAALTQQRRKYTDEVADMRKEAEALKRQVSEMADFIRKGGMSQQPQQPQEQPKPPEFDWDNPGGYIANVVASELQKALTPVARHVSNLSEYQSKKFAVQAHGVEKVNAAFAEMELASKSDPSVGPDYQRIMQSGDAWDELVKWYDRREMLKEYGSDPNAYEAKVEAKILERLRSGKSPAAAGGKSAPRLNNLPTDLAGVRSVAPRAGPAWQGPKSIKEILGR